MIFPVLCICKRRVYFFNCNFYGGFILENNILKLGTDLFSYIIQPFRNFF